MEHLTAFNFNKSAMTVSKPNRKWFQEDLMQILRSISKLYGLVYLLNTCAIIKQYIIITITLYFTWYSQIRILQIASPPPPIADYDPHFTK